MDKALQIILASLVSLGIGVAGAIFFIEPEKNTNTTTESLTTSSTENDKSKAEIDELKKSLEETQAKLNAPLDYFKLTSELKKINTDIQSEISKKYEAVELRDKVNQVKLHYVYSKLISFQRTKTAWYTATVAGEGKNKLVFYFNYYSCAQPSVAYEKVKASSKDACFTVWTYSLLNEKWSQDVFSSNVDYFLWHADSPFLKLDMSFLGSYADQTHIIRAFLPIPDEDGKVTFLKYSDGKIIWEDAAATIDWVPTTKEESEKFHKDIPAS
jgi:hypothetical protein